MKGRVVAESGLGKAQYLGDNLISRALNKQLPSPFITLSLTILLSSVMYAISNE